MLNHVVNALFFRSLGGHSDTGKAFDSMLFDGRSGARGFGFERGREIETVDARNDFKDAGDDGTKRAHVVSEAFEFVGARISRDSC